jgi:hypothetical protein
MVEMESTQVTRPVGLDRDDLDMALDAIRQYASTHLPDAKLRQLDAADEFPEAIVREMCGEGLGVSLLFIDEEFGGMGGGAVDIYRVCEQLAAIDVGIATGVLATFLGSDPILFGGTPEQRKHWMTRIAAEGLLMAYGATEPEAGSDLASMKTTAEPVVEEGQVVGYLLNGNKQWISNGGYADVYTVLARAPGGPTWFVVERDTPGFDIPRERPPKGGFRIGRRGSGASTTRSMSTSRDVLRDQDGAANVALRTRTSIIAWCSSLKWLRPKCRPGGFGCVGTSRSPRGRRRKEIDAFGTTPSSATDARCPRQATKVSRSPARGARSPRRRLRWSARRRRWRGGRAARHGAR